MKIKEINFENVAYPDQLRKIENPPKKLYVLGNEKILNKESISIIGSRCCTIYGADMAKYFAKKLVRKGIVVISGMAKGIDSFAHLGAIEGGGETIAVLGSGFNHIFPDKDVYEKILKNNGAVITEYDKDVEVFPQGFRDRNRIVAGLSVGTLIIEAKKKSGTSITAEYARRFGKTIFCIPHAIEDEAGTGTNKQLKNGAILVTDVEDLLPYFKSVEKNHNQQQDIEVEIPEEYQEVYNAIEGREANAEEISKKIKMNISKVNTILTMLELEGYVVSLPGNYFKKSMQLKD